jgi:hypothetical protein
MKISTFFVNATVIIIFTNKIFFYDILQVMTFYYCTFRKANFYLKIRNFLNFYWSGFFLIIFWEIVRLFVSDFLGKIFKFFHSQELETELRKLLKKDYGICMVFALLGA